MILLTGLFWIDIIEMVRLELLCLLLNMIVTILVMSMTRSSFKSTCYCSWQYHNCSSSTYHNSRQACHPPPWTPPQEHPALHSPPTAQHTTSPTKSSQTQTPHNDWPIPSFISLDGPSINQSMATLLTYIYICVCLINYNYIQDMFSLSAGMEYWWIIFECIFYGCGIVMYGSLQVRCLVYGFCGIFCIVILWGVLFLDGGDCLVFVLFAFFEHLYNEYILLLFLIFPIHYLWPLILYNY